MGYKRKLALLLTVSMIMGNTVTAFAVENTGAVTDPDTNVAQTEDTESAGGDAANLGDAGLTGTEEAGDRIEEPEAPVENAGDNDPRNEDISDEPEGGDTVSGDETETEPAEEGDIAVSLIVNNEIFRDGTEEPFVDEEEFSVSVDQILNESSDSEVVIKLEADWTVEESTTLDFADGIDRVVIDLNDNTLTLKSDPSYIYASKITNGEILIEEGNSLHISSDTWASDEDYLIDHPVTDILLDDLKISEAPSDEDDDEDDDTFIYFDGANGERIRIGEEIGAEDSGIALSDITVIDRYDEHVITDDDEEYTIENNILDIAGLFSMEGDASFSVGNKDGAKPHINILQKEDENSDNDLRRSLDFDGISFGLYYDKEFHENENSTELRPVFVTDDEREEGSLVAGDVLGSIKDGKAYNEDGEEEDINDIGKIFSLPESLTEQSLELMLDDGSLVVGEVEILGEDVSSNRVRYNDSLDPVEEGTIVVEYDKEGVIQTETKQTFEGAIKVINDTNAAEYRLTFSGYSYLNKDIDIRKGVKKLTFTTSGNEAATLDFWGHTLSYTTSGSFSTGSMEITGGLILRSKKDIGNLIITSSKSTAASLELRPDKELIINDALVKFVNIKVDGPNSVNQLTIYNDSERENYVIPINGNNIETGQLYLKSGKYLIQSVHAGKITVAKGAEMNIADLEATDLVTNNGTIGISGTATIAKLDNVKGAKLSAPNLEVTNALYLEPESTLYIENEGTIANLYLGRNAAGQAVAGGSPELTRLEKTNLYVNTRFQKKSATDKPVVVKTLDIFHEAESTIIGTQLFRTDIASFPLDQLQLEQPADYPDTELIQAGSTILVASSKWIVIKAENEVIKSFAKWTDAVTYINTINNPAVDYSVVLSADVTSNGGLAFPSKAKSFTVKGEDPDHPVSIRYTGNIVPTTDTVFENLILVPGTYDKTAGFKDNDASTINLNGKTLEWKNTYSKNKFASITGSGASALILDSTGREAEDKKMTLSANKVITVPNLTIKDYRLVSETDGLTASSEAYLASAEIDVKSNITFRNLHTLDGNNTITYAGAPGNTFKINGTVDSKDTDNKTVQVRGKNDTGTETAEINKNAIEIHAKYIEEKDPIKDSEGKLVTPMTKSMKYGYTTYKKNNRGQWVEEMDYTTRDLVISAKASAAYFVIGKQDDSIQYALKKDGNALRVQPDLVSNVELYRTTSGGKEILGYYRTLQEALNDIDRYADKNGEYIIYLDGSKQYDITPSVNRINLNMPKQAGFVTITTKDDPADMSDYAQLYMNNTLNLNSNLKLNKVVIADNTNTKLNIGMGGYELDLIDVPVANDRIGNITGNGTAKTSSLTVKQCGTGGILTVNGTISNIGKVTTDSTSIKATGQVTVGGLYGDPNSSYQEYLIGPVKSVTRDSKNADKARRNDITAITPNITITGVAGNINIGLTDPARKVTVSGGNLTASDIPEGNPVLTNGAFAVAAAPNVNSEAVGFGWATGNGDEYAAASGTLFKKNGNLVYTSMNEEEIPYLLSYSTSGTSPDDTLTYCMSFADAVAEINKLAVKRDYTIAVNKDAADLQSPANLSMPQAKNIASLTLQGTDKGGISNGSISSAFADLYYTGGTITLTCPVTFDNLRMNRVKLGADKKYVSENTAGEDYLTATTLKSSGYDMTYKDKVVWDTPLNMDGGKKGNFVIKDNALVYTDIDKADARYQEGVMTKGAFINGSVTSVGTIDLASDQKLIIKGFKTAATNGKESYAVPSLTATTVNISGGSMEVGDFDGNLIPKAGVSEDHVYYPLNQPANVTVTALNVIGNDGESLVAHGKLTVTNLTLKTNSAVSTNIVADRDFSIANKGTLVCVTSDANLITRRNSKGVPYLTIPGTVELQDKDNKIGVTVRPSVEDIKKGTVSDCPIVLPEKVNGVYTDASRQLLTAASARADMFRTSGGAFLIRNDKAKTIVAYAEEEKKIEVIGSASLDNKASPYDRTSDDDEYWYPTWADAVNAVNYMNAPNRYYTFVFNEDIGVDPADPSGKLPKPVAFTMPAKGKAKGIYITSTSGVKSIYYTGAITLNCPAEFIDIDLNPLASVKKDNKTNVSTVNGAKSNITAGDHELSLIRVTVGEKFNELAADEHLKKTGASQIGDMTTGVKGTIIIDSNLSVEGKVNAATLEIDGKKLTAGNNGVTVSKLVMNGRSVLSDTAPSGKITITDIESKGQYNKIEYGRNKNHATNLEIKGEYTKTDDNCKLQLNMISDNGIPIDDTKTLENYGISSNTALTWKGGLISNPKVNLPDSRKLFIAPKMYSLSNGSRNFNLTVNNKTLTTNAQMVKANNAFWIMNRTEVDLYNNTTKAKAVIKKAGKNDNPPMIEARIDTDDQDGKTTIFENRVQLNLTNRTDKQRVTFQTEYLDWNQAITEINNLNDPDAKYKIMLVGGQIYDTNMTDNNWRSALTMPGNNKAASIYVTASTSTPKSLRFSGAVTTYGHVEMNALILNSQNNKGDAPADFNITMNPNSAKEQAFEPGLFMNKVTTMADHETWEDRVFKGTEIANRTGFIGKISGSAKKTENLQISVGDIRVKSGIANVDELKLIDAQVISVGGTTANTLNMKSTGTVSSNLTALAASTVGTVTADDESFIGTMGQANTKAAFTISGTVNDDIKVKVKSVGSVGQKDNVISFIPGAGQADVRLVTAPKADAECFVAADLDRSGIIAYKDASNIVYNGRLSDMTVKLERYEAGDNGYPDAGSQVLAKSYAKSYKDVISMINAAADRESAYKITFLKAGEEVTKVETASVNGTHYYSYSFGALTWPKANTASSLVINGDPDPDNNDNDLAELRYTGTLKPNAANLKVKFEDIILTEGTTKKTTTTSVNEAGKKVNITQTVFTPNYMITPDLSGANGAEIYFGIGAKTLTPDAITDVKPQERQILGLAENAPISGVDLVLSKTVSTTRFAANKLTFSGQRVLLRAASTMQTVETARSSDYYSTYLYTVSPLAVNGEVTGITSLILYNAFTDYVAAAPGKPFAGFGNSQFTINGDLLIQLELRPYVDINGAKGAIQYVPITKAQLVGVDGSTGTVSGSGLDTGKIGSYPAYAKLATAKKANASLFGIRDQNNYYNIQKSPKPIKNNGALYISSATTVVKVTRKKGNRDIGTTEYESWDMAVTEINNIADTGSHYSITLLKDIGGLGGFNEKSAAFNAGGYAYSDEDSSLQNKPLSTLAMPAKAASVTITSEDPSNPAFIMTTAAKLTPACDTDFDNVGIIRLSAKKNDLYNYAAANYDLVVNGRINVDGLNRRKTFHYKKGGVETPCSAEEAFVSNIGAVTGNNKGVLFLLVDGSVEEAPIPIGSVTGIDRLLLENTNSNTVMFIVNGRLAPGQLEIAIDKNNSVYVHATQDINVNNLSVAHGSKLSAGKGITANKELKVYNALLFAGYSIGGKEPGSFTEDDPATADINAGEASVGVVGSGENPVLTAKNVSIKTSLDLGGGKITAGQGITKAGDGGKITIAELNLYPSYIENELHVKQDKNGKSQLAINGIVEDKDGDDEHESTATVAVHYPDWSNYAKVYNGIQLATLPKAEASFFRPYVNAGDGVPDMGKAEMYNEDGTYQTYKSGTSLCYGDTSGFEARLYCMTKDNLSGVTDFATLEEALKEIGTLNRRYKVGNTWHYEDYAIQLLKDVDIQNAKGDYVAPAMPTAVDTLIISGDVPDIVFDHEDPQKNKTMKHLTYGGSLTIRSNTMLSDMLLQQKAAKPQALSLGNFHLVLDNVYQDVVEEDDGRIVFKPLEFGAVSGGSQSGRLVLASGNPCDDYGLYTVKADSVSGLHSVELLDDTMMDVAGNYSANRVIFSTENTDSTHVGDAALKVDGNLTVQQIQKATYLPATTIPVFINAALYLNGTKTNKVNGIKNKDGKFVTLADPSDEATQLEGDGIISICRTDNKLGRTFTIWNEAATLSDNNVEASDIVAQTNKYGLLTNNRIVIRDKNGEKLLAGVDYYSRDDDEHGFKYYYETLPGDAETYNIDRVDPWRHEVEVEKGSEAEEYDSVPEGTKIKVVITGKGHYAGQDIVGYYYFVYGDVGGSYVEIKDQYYTGSHIEPAPEDIKVWIDSNGDGDMDYKLQNTEYTIVSTGFDNIEPGYGKLTISGKHDNVSERNFSGTRTVKFRILPRIASAP